MFRFDHQRHETKMIDEHRSPRAKMKILTLRFYRLVSSMFDQHRHFI